MHNTHLYTGPTRSSDEIAADRKAANAFFAAYDTPTSRNAPRIRDLLAYYGRDWNLICCEIEARAWTRSHPRNTLALQQDRRTRRADAEGTSSTGITLERDDTQRRRYVHLATNNAMPARRIHTPTGEPATVWLEANRFWARLGQPHSPLHVQALTETDPYVWWLLLHPLYGPQHDAPAGYQGSMRRLKKTAQPKRRPRHLYKKGQIRPAGMSYQRALQIAIAALDATE